MTKIQLRGGLLDGRTTELEHVPSSGIITIHARLAYDTIEKWVYIRADDGIYDFSHIDKVWHPTNDAWPPTVMQSQRQANLLYFQR